MPKRIRSGELGHSSQVPVRPDTDSEEELEVESILNKKTHEGKTYYLLKWRGHDETTWEPAENLSCDALKRKFDKTCSKSKRVVHDEDNEDWEVEEILDKRINADGELQYLFKWKGWPGQPTWELARTATCLNLIASFENPKLRRMWDFRGNNYNLWIGPRLIHQYMRKYRRMTDTRYHLLRFLHDFPPSEEPPTPKEGLNIGPLRHENHWYLIVIFINYVTVTRMIFVGDALNTLIGTDPKIHPVVRRLKKIYPDYNVKPATLTQMERSDVCGYYILAAFERALFLYRPNAHLLPERILFDTERAELIRSKIYPRTNGLVSVTLKVPEAFQLKYVCEFCHKQLENHSQRDRHIEKEHIGSRAKR